MLKWSTVLYDCLNVRSVHEHERKRSQLLASYHSSNDPRSKDEDGTSFATLSTGNIKDFLDFVGFYQTHHILECT